MYKNIKADCDKFLKDFNNIFGDVIEVNNNNSTDSEIIENLKNENDELKSEIEELKKKVNFLSEQSQNNYERYIQLLKVYINNKE